jgi:hypothetical protein
MAVINHTFVEVNTSQTTTSATYVDVPGAAITSGNFTAGKKYLLYLTCKANENSGGFVHFKVLHGSTDFVDTDIFHSVSGTNRLTYTFMTVWTAVASEGVKLQFSVSSGTAAVDHVAFIAINLTDNLTENVDWFYDEDTVDEGLGVTPDDGATVTFTPGTAGHDWLVLTHSFYDATSTSAIATSYIERSGEASSTTPSSSYQPSATASVFFSFGLARVYTLSNVSNTFKEVSVGSEAGNIRFMSRIFALNLNKFRNHSFAYTEAGTNLSITDYATLAQTINITPDVSSSVWILSYWNYNKNSASNLAESRIQLDNTDQPSGQTTANYQYGWRNPGLAADEDGHPQHTLATSVSAAAHTIDLDTSTSSTSSTPTAQHRFIAAVTMELASTDVALSVDSGSYSISGTAAVLRPGSTTILEHRR